MRRLLINNAAREKIRQAPLAIVVCGCLAKTLIPLNTLIIGYLKNQVAAKDKWKEENISYNKLDGEKFIIQEKEEEIGKEEK